MIGAVTYHYEQESGKSLVEDNKYRKKERYWKGTCLIDKMLYSLYRIWQGTECSEGDTWMV